MRFKLLFCSLLIFIQSCNGFVHEIDKTPSEVQSFNFPDIIKLSDSFLQSSSYQMIQSLSEDGDGNTYIFGHVNGQDKKGVITGSRDVYVLKLDQNGEVLWSFLLNDSLPTVIDSSLNEELASSFVSNDAIYVYGTTRSNLVENNINGNADLFVFKLNLSGSLLWIKHFGETTQDAEKFRIGNNLIDWGGSDFASHISMGSNQKLYLSYTSYRSFYEVSTNTNGDIGYVRLDPNDGQVEFGMQLGSATATALSLNTDEEELNTQSIFRFDGSLLISPFKTKSSLIETNTSGLDDFAYLSLDDELNVVSITHFGEESYNTYALANSITGGSVTNSIQSFNDVVINGSGDYLFFGKNVLTKFVEQNNGGNSDSLFMRYQSGALSQISHYGVDSLPSGGNAEEPRACKKHLSFNYCLFHSSSMLFGTDRGTLTPGVYKVDNNGVLIEGRTLRGADINGVSIPNSDLTIVSGREFIIRNDKIIFGVNNITNLNQSIIFSMDLF